MTNVYNNLIIVLKILQSNTNEFLILKNIKVKILPQWFVVAVAVSQFVQDPINSTFV